MVRWLAVGGESGGFFGAIRGIPAATIRRDRCTAFRRKRRLLLRNRADIRIRFVDTACQGRSLPLVRAEQARASRYFQGGFAQNKSGRECDEAAQGVLGKTRPRFVLARTLQKSSRRKARSPIAIGRIVAMAANTMLISIPPKNIALSHHWAVERSLRNWSSMGKSPLR